MRCRCSSLSTAAQPRRSKLNLHSHYPQLQESGRLTHAFEKPVFAPLATVEIRNSSPTLGGEPNDANPCQQRWTESLVVAGGRERSGIRGSCGATCVEHGVARLWPSAHRSRARRRREERAGGPSASLRATVCRSTANRTVPRPWARGKSVARRRLSVGQSPSWRQPPGLPRVGPAPRDLG